MQLEEYSKSRDAIKTQVNLGLSITLLSFVSVIKGAVNSGSEFQYLDCLSISVTGFLIMFVSLFSNQKVFEEWKDNFRRHSRTDRILFLGSPLVLIILVVVLVWFVKNINFTVDLSDLIPFPETYKIFRIVFLILKFIVRSSINFFGYSLISSFLATEWIHLSAYTYDFFYKKLLESQERKNK